LFFIKFFNVPFFLDNKRIAKKLGWNFKDDLMEMPLSLPKYFNIKNNELSKCVCFVGRLSKSKGISDLIKSWRIVVDKVPESLLYIIGTDNGNGMYQKMIHKYKLQDSIIITGFLSYEEKMEIMHKCSIFTFPSYEEGWALAVMEAIDMGLLPVVYDLPAYDYICTNKIKVKISDRRKLALLTIHYLLNDNERLHLVEKLQNCILHYTEEVVINEWLDQVSKKFV
jgi:glycosyltransferase involved in cell wall biosynthesis